MKKTCLLILSVLLILMLGGCSEQLDPDEYKDYVKDLTADAKSCGYEYSNGTAVYTVKQRGGDGSISFVSSADPSMNMRMSSVGGRVIYANDTAFFEDTKNEYSLPFDDGTVMDWLFDELKTYGVFAYEKEETTDGKVYDFLKSSKTVKADNEMNVEYDQYTITFTYKDGKAYTAEFFDCADESQDLIAGERPDEITVSNGWKVDIGNKKLYQSDSSESYDITVSLVDSKKNSGTPTDQESTAELMIDRSTKQLHQVTITTADQTDVYTLLYPDAIDEIGTDGLNDMPTEQREYTASMIALMKKSL